MIDVSQLGKAIIVAGAIIVLIGVLLLAVGNVPFLGRLPGDFVIRRDNVTIYIPLATMLVVSLLLTIISVSFFVVSSRQSEPGLRTLSG